MVSTAKPGMMEGEGDSGDCRSYPAVSLSASGPGARQPAGAGTGLHMILERRGAGLY